VRVPLLKGAAKNAPKPATILVVDDSPVNLQVLVRTLDGTGHRILVATGGKAAIDIAQRARPDLILLDVMMPGMDGFAVCRTIKENPATRDIVIIFLSALGEVADKVAGLEMGAADYITKPIQADEVLARVATHLIQQQLEREVRLSRDSLDRELSSAAEMQRMILPPVLPRVGDLTFAAYYQTSRYVGGDYYDVVRLPGEQCGVLIADVSGHGATSAIIMAMIRAAFHACPTPPVDPPSVLRYLNAQFRFLWETPLLATAFYAVIDSRTRRMSMACAGHLAPLLVRGGAVQPVQFDGTIPLLLNDLTEIPRCEQVLEAGDRVLFYTDGITEREDRDGAMYELPRLCEALSRSHTLLGDDFLQAVIQDVEAFAAGEEPHDDQTLLLVSVVR
jgi:sigma-B regulation protein RsbU (phosphoserine phosphatase)